VPSAFWPNNEDFAMDLGFWENILQFPDMEVVEVRLDASEKALHLELRWKEESGRCPKCGAEARKRKLEPRKEPVRHLDCIGHKTLLYFDALELECTACRKLFNRKPSFMSEPVFISGAYLDGMMKQAQGTSVATAAQWNGQSGSSFAEMYYGQLKKADEGRVIPPVRRLGVDETAFLRGRGNYVLLLHDLDRHDVIDVLPDRRKETLKDYLEEHREGVFAGLEAVCIDMWKPYKQAVESVFPNAEIVVDRFHVMQNLNEALDECRRGILKKTKDAEIKDLLRKEYRFILLRAREEQVSTPEGRKELQNVLNLDPELKSLYRLKEGFRQIYRMRSPGRAAKALQKWLRRAQYAGSRYLKDFLQTVKNWKTEILNFAKHAITNGSVEGTNCKVKLVKRLGYGYKSFENFRLRILHVCCKSLCLNGLH